MSDQKFNERRASEGAAAAYAFIAVILMIVGLLVMLLWPRPAAAHAWYDNFCCSDKDCVAVVPSAVTAKQDGWHVVLGPGQHPMVTEPLAHVYRYDSARVLPSRDQDFHVCVNSWGRVLCLYVPEFGA